MSIERLTDRGLEAWDSATDLTNWTESIAGTSTINRETTTIHGGIYSARLDIDASNSLGKISQTFIMVSLKKNKIKIWYKNSASGKTSHIKVRDSASNVWLDSAGAWQTSDTYITLANSTSWKLYTLEFLANASYTNYNLDLGRLSTASSSIYFDDVSLLETHNGKGGLFMGMGISMV